MRLAGERNTIEGKWQENGREMAKWDNSKQNDTWKKTKTDTNVELSSSSTHRSLVLVLDDTSALCKTVLFGRQTFIRTTRF